MMEVCRRCGGGLTFAGFDALRQRVLMCVNSLTVKKSDGSTDSVACDVKGEFIVDGRPFNSVNWLRVERERR